MRRFSLLLPLALASCASFALPGCSSGLGSLAPKSGPAMDCSPCDIAKTIQGGVPGEVAAAAASGGQTASNQPTQTDPTRINPNVLASSGAGDATWTKSDTESRRQAGAPSVNQGLVLPTAADARTGGGVSPVVASLQALVDDLRERLRSVACGDTTTQAQLLAAIADAHAAMAQAQAGAQAQTNNTYNFDGAKIVQTVGNSSNSGEGNAAAETPIPPSNALRSVPETTKAVMDAPPDPAAPEAAAKSPLPASDCPPSGPLPPADGSPK